MCTCSDHYLSVDRYMSSHSVHFYLYEWYIVSCVDAASDVAQSFW